MADNGGKHVKKAKKMPGSRIVFAIGSLVLLYFGLQIVDTLLNGVETITATRVTAYDSITATGCFLRNETVIQGSTQTTVEQSVQSGQKIKLGTILAVEYNSESALQLSQQSQNIANQITLLQSAIQSSGESTDTGKIDQLISSQMQTLANNAEKGVINNLQANITEIRRLTMRRAIGGQDVATLQNELTNLQSQQQTIQQNVSTQTNRIISSNNGYFSDTVDGFETVLSADEETLEELTVTELQDKLTTQVTADTSALGKVVQGFHWYFAAILSPAEAEGLTEGKNIALRFAQVSEDIPAKVYAVREDGRAGKTLVLLEGSQITNELLSMRVQTVDIIKGTYTGIKVPRSAIYMDEGVMGVYTLSGSVSNFKEIKPLYANENYYVIEQGNSAATGVVAQDNIIVKARGLSNNKVVKK